MNAVLMNAILAILASLLFAYTATKLKLVREHADLLRMVRIATGFTLFGVFCLIRGSMQQVHANSMFLLSVAGVGCFIYVYAKQRPFAGYVLAMTLGTFTVVVGLNFAAVGWQHYLLGPIFLSLTTATGVLMGLESRITYKLLPNPQ